MTTRILAIYDADLTLRDELAYAIGKLMGTRSCALCDISHGYNPLGKAEWKRRCAGTPEVEWLHRNDLNEVQKRWTDKKLPCVIVDAGCSFEFLLTAEDLERCEGDVGKFNQALMERMASSRLITTADDVLLAS